MASEVKLFRPWAAYSYDLEHPLKSQKSGDFQTELSRESSRMPSGNTVNTNMKRTKNRDLKQSAASATNALSGKHKTWCTRKRELAEKKLSTPKPAKESQVESKSNRDVMPVSPASNEVNATSSDSQKCDSSFSDKLDFFNVEPQGLDPLCVKSPLELGLNYFNYPNYYDPSVIPYGLSPEEFFGVQGEFLYPNSTDPWSDLAKFYTQANQAKVKQRPKKFQCPHCNVAFSNNGQLKGHVRIHTGERPFKCDVDGCGKSFTRNEELTRHKRIHSGLRPFGCPHCGKKFGRKDHLKKHARTHLPQPRFAPQLVPLYPFLYGY